jgi:hypothetical protein
MWLGWVTKNAHIILVRKCLGIRPLGRPNKWKDNVKTGLRETGCENGTGSGSGSYLQRKTEELEEKLVSVLLCPPQILHGLNWARTRASALRSRQLTACAMGRSVYIVTWMYVSLCRYCCSKMQGYLAAVLAVGHGPSSMREHCVGYHVS